MEPPDFTPAFDADDGQLVALPQELVRLHIHAFEQAHGRPPGTLHVSSDLFDLLLVGGHVLVHEPGNEYSFDGIDLYCDGGLPCSVHSFDVSDDEFLALCDTMNKPATPAPAPAPATARIFPRLWMLPFLEMYERNGNLLASATILKVTPANVFFQVKNHPLFAVAFRLAQREVGERIWQSIKHRVPLPR